MKFFLVMGILIILGNGEGIGANTPEKFKIPEPSMSLLAKARLAEEVGTVSQGRALEQGTIDFTGEWEIQEEDKAYQAHLDAQGNGPYNYQNGRIQTEKVVDRLWSGRWHQQGNDREGGFEVWLSEDGNSATGTWWYSRVGTNKNIPPRDWGGTYYMKRLSPAK